MGLDFNKSPGGEIEHQLDELLEDARMAASTDWEEDFVADQLANREKYGARWQPTELMVLKLKEIAEWSEPEYRGPSVYEVDRRFDDDISDLFRK
jgi:hypothetical protein